MQHEHTHPEIARCRLMENFRSFRNTFVIKNGQAFKLHVPARFRTYRFLGAALACATTEAEALRGEAL